MKAKTKEAETRDGHRERFERFGKALMAVPKKELDKELAKHERGKQQHEKRRKRA